MTLIEAQLPATWRDLEASVARILAECGYDVEVGKNVQLAGRGDANIDVWADDHSQPPNVIAVECKLWGSPVTQDVVHGFRTRVGDSGANLGLIVAAAGFQAGAVEAAAYSNVLLRTWSEFQEMFAARWFMRFMVPTLARETDPLAEYTEPVNSRIFRKADALSDERQGEFKALRERHGPLGGLNLGFSVHFYDARPVGPPDLPLRQSVREDLMTPAALIPDDVLDATALRPLMEAMLRHTRQAVQEFDAVFGERA
jgi:restriction system protein